ncbi:MAG: hypothetical protein PHH58_10680 [Rhodoferax sp.]|nr:hypothetical protein [Rhodoferax sp.]
MDPLGARQIRAAMRQVESTRLQARASPALTRAVAEVKNFQEQRFSSTYQDFLASDRFGPCASFFLRELYSAQDYTQRDAQFAKVATAIERALPQPVIATTVKLAELHDATESLDLQMAQHWGDDPSVRASSRYQRAWRALNCREKRLWQLNMVLDIGRELGRLTRKPGLRLLLKMMRRPASLAGLSDLQGFLESGFDRFAQLSKDPAALQCFLETIETREHDWINRFETAPT